MTLPPNPSCGSTSILLLGATQPARHANPANHIPGANRKACNPTQPIYLMRNHPQHRRPIHVFGTRNITPFSGNATCHTCNATLPRLLFHPLCAVEIYREAFIGHNFGSSTSRSDAGRTVHCRIDSSSHAPQVHHSNHFFCTPHVTHSSTLLIIIGHYT